MTRVYWLRYKSSSVSFLHFEDRGATVHFKGPQGCASYIDREVPKSEARALYADCVKDGYRPNQSSEAPGPAAFDAFTYGR